MFSDAVDAFNQIFTPPFRKVLVWGRDAANAEACARDISSRLGIPAEAASAERTVRDSQLVITTTPARQPVLQAAWLNPGLHITAMGSDQAGKNEIEAAAIARATLYVCDRVSQAEKLGELRSAQEAGHLAGITPPELGEIVSGSRPGRRTQDDITICDLTGTGAQDTAIATFALEAARAAAAGTLIKA